MNLIRYYFRENDNDEVKLPLLVKFIETRGYSYELAIQTIEELLKAGFIYTPIESYLRKTQD